MREKKSVETCKGVIPDGDLHWNTWASHNFPKIFHQGRRELEWTDFSKFHPYRCAIALHTYIGYSWALPSDL